MQLNEIDGELLKRAIKSYLSLAYPHGTAPERIQPSLTWEAGLRCDQWCTDDRIEVCKGAQGTQYFLRLGNHFYPNMKLGIVACAGDEEEFVFVADTHDRHFEIDDDQLGALRFREVQRKNEDLKEKIEAQWQMEGIPTFGSFNNFFNQSFNFTPLNSHGLNILIADDTPATLQLERIILEKQGFNVIECDDGIAVLEVAKTYAIDAAVLDIMMPEMDGYKVVKSLEQSGLRRFPIAFSSAMPMDKVKTGIADAFIQKPFSPKHFAEAVKSLLRSTKEMMMY